MRRPRPSKKSAAKARKSEASQLLQDFAHHVDEIREAIGYPLLYETHFSSRKDVFNKLCIAHDTLEDSVLALEDFCQIGLGQRGGENYLRLYGAFQAVFLQQDSLRSLWEVSFEEEQFPAPSRDSAWKTIREIRNLTTGHPTEVERAGEVHRTAVSRAHLRQGQMYLVTYERNSGKTEQRDCDIDELLSCYLREATPLASSILVQVRQRFPPPDGWE